MGRAGLQDCYRHVDALSHQLLGLHDRFGFSNSSWLVYSTQIDMQQVSPVAEPSYGVNIVTANAQCF